MHADWVLGVAFGVGTAYFNVLGCRCRFGVCFESLRSNTTTVGMRSVLFTQIITALLRSFGKCIQLIFQFFVLHFHRFKGSGTRRKSSIGSFTAVQQNMSGMTSARRVAHEQLSAFRPRQVSSHQRVASPRYSSCWSGRDSLGRTRSYGAPQMGARRCLFPGNKHSAVGTCYVLLVASGPPI